MKTLRTLATLGTMVLMSLMVSSPAEAAIIITPSDATCTDNVTSAAGEEARTETCAGGLDLDFLYKSNFQSGTGLGSDSGDYADEYITIFDPTVDPTNATITFVGTDPIECPTCWLVVKDGNNDPANYYINLGSWDGEETLEIQGFWEGVTGSISHISIYGTPTGGTPGGGTTPGGQELPEPASLLLLGCSLGAAAYTARRRRNRD